MYACIILGACIGSKAYAADFAGTPPADDSSLFFLTGPLFLQERYLGDIDIKVDIAGKGVLDSTRFLQLLEPLVSAELSDAFTAAARDKPFIPFDSLSINGVNVNFDPQTLGINVKLPANLRSSSTMRFSGMRTPNPATANQPASTVAGLRLSGQKLWIYGDAIPLQSETARAEGFVTLGGFEGVTIDGALNYNSAFNDRTIVDDFKLTKDFFSNATRLQVGEIQSLGAGMQSSTALKGVGLYRQYQAIRPFQNVRPTGRQSLLLEQPSTVEIYVNGTILQTLNLPPGPYELDDFPLLDGFNDVQFHIRDSSGNEEVIDRSVFYSPAILGDGITDFGVWAGEPAYQYEQGNEYLTSAYLMRGFGIATLGANTQVSTTGYQIGNTAVIAGKSGFLSLDIAWGEERKTGRNGVSAAINGHLSLSLWEEDDLRLDLRAERYGRDSFDPMSGTADHPQLWQSSFTGALIVNQDTSVSFGATAYRRTGHKRTSWSSNFGVTRRFGELSVSMYATHSEPVNGVNDSSFRLSLTLPLGQDSRAASRYDSRSGRSEIELNRLRRQQTSDWSANARVGSEPSQQDADLEAQWYGQRMFAGVNHTSSEASDSAQGTVHRSTLQASTTIGYADGTLGWGRSSQTGFTVVDVHPSLDDTNPYFVQSGEVMYRDDGLGPALVPAPLGYSLTDQEVVIDNLPVGYSLPETVRTIMPGYVSGYAFTIGTDSYRSITGLLVTPDDKPAALLLGKLIPEDPDVPTVDFFSSTSGQFFAEGLAEGEYRIEIKGTVRGSVSIPGGGNIMVDVGRVTIHE